MRKFRLRRCKGNKDAWIIVLVLVRDDGQESEVTSCSVTGMSPGDTLNIALRIKLFKPGDQLMTDTVTF